MSTPRPKGPSLHVPLIGTTVIQVCPRGHIEKVPAPGVGLVIGMAEGKLFYPLCPVCQRDFFTSSFPSRVLPAGSTNEDAKVEILRWQEEIDRQMNVVPPSEPS